MDGPVIVSGAAIHTRPPPLACVVLIGPGPSSIEDKPSDLRLQGGTRL